MDTGCCVVVGGNVDWEERSSCEGWSSPSPESFLTAVARCLGSLRRHADKDCCPAQGAQQVLTRDSRRDF